MKLSDIQNVLILARQGVKDMAREVNAKEGAAAFASIAAVEEWAQSLVNQHAEQQSEQAENTEADENGQSVQVVEVQDEEIVATEETDKENE